jgi:hypothetical protein
MFRKLIQTHTMKTALNEKCIHIIHLAAALVHLKVGHFTFDIAKVAKVRSSTCEHQHLGSLHVENQGIIRPAFRRFFIQDRLEAAGGQGRASAY